MEALKRVGPFVSMTLLLSTVSLADAQLEKQGTYTSQFGWYASGKTYEVEKDHALFVGEFSGTNFNDAGRGFGHLVSVVCPGINDINKGAQTAHGYCTLTDHGGDKLFAVWKCQGSPCCDGDFQWIGGTGKYAGISGANAFYAVTLVPTLSGYSIWKGEWKLP